MKLSEMFIGQLVMYADKKERNNTIIPKVGKVVDIALQYCTEIIIRSTSESVPILPVVHFVGEQFPRPIHPSNIVPYKED